ncbi:MAG: hypothetical protein QM790_00195 [Nibricoccus sp.]
MLNGKAILIFLCIFLAGGVAGHFTGMRMACAQRDAKPSTATQVQNQPRRPVEEWSNRFQKQFVERVGVSPEFKKEKIDPLVQAAQAEFRRIREDSFHEMGNITEQLDADVMARLSDEQKAKYQELISERQERFKKKEAERAAAAAAAAARGEPPPKPYGPKSERQPPPTSETKPASDASPAPAAADTTATQPKAP